MVLSNSANVLIRHPSRVPADSLDQHPGPHERLLRGELAKTDVPQLLAEENPGAGTSIPQSALVSQRGALVFQSLLDAQQEACQGRTGFFRELSKIGFFNFCTRSVVGETSTEERSHLCARLKRITVDEQRRSRATHLCWSR